MVWYVFESFGQITHLLGCIIVPLSFLGCLWTCYFCLKRRIMNTFLKYILGLTLANLFYTVANIMSLFRTGDLDSRCKIEGVIRESSWILSLIFASCIAILCYKSSACDGSSFNHSRFFRASLTVGFLVCSVLVSG